MTRPYSKFGSTQDKAKNALLVSMMQRQQEKGRLAENPSLKDVAENWLSSIEVPQVVVDENGNMVSVGSTTMLLCASYVTAAASLPPLYGEPIAFHCQ